MRRRVFLAAGSAAAATLAVGAFGQDRKPASRVSFLSSSSPKSYAHLLDEFRAALRSLGYTEGRDFMLDPWWAEDRLDRLPALIAELMSTRPAVILTHGSANVAALQKATASVPIVFASAGDPVGQGFVASLGRPGGNITGVAFNEDVTQKLYEVMKMVMPGASRVATLVNPDNPAAKHILEAVPATAKTLGLQTLIVNATTASALEPAFARATAAKMQALVVTPLAPFIGLSTQIIELQFKYRLPTFHAVRESVADGGLASYSFSFEENFRRAAAMVDQILKGRSPAEIPVELPTKYEIAINLKAAKALGIKVPESALLRAHQVVQ